MNRGRTATNALNRQNGSPAKISQRHCQINSNQPSILVRMFLATPAFRRRKLARAIVATLTILLFCAASPQLAFAQEVLWNSYYQAGKKDLAAGRYAQAEKKLSSALKEAERFPPGEGESASKLSSTLRAYAEVLSTMHRFDKAEPIYQKLVDLKLDKREQASDLNDFARNQEQQSKFKQSIELYERALALLKDDESAQLSKIGVMVNLSAAYMGSGDFTRSEEILRESMTTAEKLHEKRAIADVLLAFGRLYSLTGRFEEAESVLKKSVSTLKELGPSGQELLDAALLNLGRTYRSLGDVEKAKDCLQHAIDLAKTNSRPNTYEATLEMAKLYEEQGWMKDASSLLEGSIKELEKTFGDASPLVAEQCRQMATECIELNEYERAQTLLKRALSIDETVYGANGAATANDLQSLGMLYVRQGKYAEAEPVYKRSLEIVQKAYGDSHPNVAACLNNLAWLYVNQRKFDLARPLVERGLEIRTKNFGNEHPLVARNMANLAELEIACDNLEKARRLLETALSIQKTAVGPDHPDTITSMNQLAEILAKLKHHSEARELYSQLLSLDEKGEGKNSPAVAADLQNLAREAIALNQVEDAKDFTRRFDAIKEKLPGSVPELGDHGIVIDALATRKPLKSVEEKWALVVGISNFKDHRINLKYAAKDAMDFRNYLIFEANFKPDHVKLLLDGEATRDGIVANLGERWLGKHAQRDDMVVVYVSSHGTSAVRDVGDTNFIAAYETNVANVVFTGIPMQWFTAGINNIIQAARVIIIMDVCHGGALAPVSSDFATTANAKAAASKQQGEKALLRQIQLSKKDLGAGSGRVVIASSQSDQTSWESKAYPNGVFTRKLIEGLRSAGPNTTLKDAFNHMRSKVELEVLRDRQRIQTPVMLVSDQGGSLVLAVKPSVSGQTAAVNPTKSAPRK